MFKTHSQKVSKESLVALGVTVALVALVIINVAIMIPTLLKVYTSPKGTKSPEAINTQAVNDALKVIEESKN